MKPETNPAQRLKLARPPFRPVCAPASPHTWKAAGALAARTAGFAAALQTRFSGRTGFFGSPGLVYRRNALGLFVQRIQRHTHLTLAPQVQLTFQTLPGQARRLQPVQAHAGAFRPLQIMTPGHPVLPSPALKPAAVLVWARGLAQIADTNAHPLEVHRLVVETSRLALRSRTETLERLLRRFERYETVRRISTPAYQSGSPLLPAGNRLDQPFQTVLPVQKVLINRRQIVLSEASQPAETRPQPPTRLPAWAAPGWEAPGLAQTDFNIQRLADQVVQVIDDRVIARRERLGRI